MHEHTYKYTGLFVVKGLELLYVNVRTYM